MYCNQSTMISNRIRLLSRLSSPSGTVGSCRHRNGSLVPRPRCNSRRTFQTLQGTFVGDHLWNPSPQQQSTSRQQVRWKRKSGSSADDPKPRRWSKKQKKRFRRKLEREREMAKHAAPGSKAGPRREYLEELQQDMMEEYQQKLNGTYDQLLESGKNPLEDPALEYTPNDALLDDLIGNASSYSGQATPEPIYYGHRQRALFNRVVDKMEAYQEQQEQLEAATSTAIHGNATKSLLPTDKEISLAIKAYRDQHGTKQRPIGIARALQHVLQDLKIPSLQECCGEYSYNALLTCCRTPKEGLKVFQLMHDNNHFPISHYSWAILMDIHAKVGDFEGCVRVLDEMDRAGREPNLAAYTSLLAACYKVCNDGRVAHKIRAQAGEVGWKKWQELHIRGLEPDVMCYGAMLRLCAARGQPERCMNLLEEMPRFEVAPTTLCFSAALKAIAKSHETAIRYQRGFSKANKRRERITAHHGKMAHDVVILAEAAKVELDDGFVSALQLCAAAAGDSATAKAIYLASKVQRNMKHWRSIGGDYHLARLRGDDPATAMQLEGGRGSLQIANGDLSSPDVVALQKPQQQQRALSFGEREYGKDTRTLSAILRACAQASDTNGVGTMWSGRQNYGYLDLTSLRLIQQYRKPEYRNSDVPGVSRTEFGINTMVDSEDLISPRKRGDPTLQRGARRKYPGFITMEGTPLGLYDLPDDQYFDYFDETGMLKQEYIETGEYPEYERIQRHQRNQEANLELEQQSEVEQIDAGTSVASKVDDSSAQSASATPMYFCMEERRWKIAQRPEAKDSVSSKRDDTATVDLEAKDEADEVEWFFDVDARKWATREKQHAMNLESSETQRVDASPLDVAALDHGIDDVTREEWYFDDDARCWKTRIVPVTTDVPSVEHSMPTLTDFEARAIEEITCRIKVDEQDEVCALGGEEDDEVEIDEEELEEAMMAVQAELDSNGGKFKSQQLEGEFVAFFDHLKQEMTGSGEDSGVEENEARQLFVVMRKQFDASGEEDMELGVEEKPEHDGDIPTLARGRKPPKQDFEDIMQELRDEWDEDGDEIGTWSDDDEEMEKSTEISAQMGTSDNYEQSFHSIVTTWQTPGAYLQAQVEDQNQLGVQLMEPTKKQNNQLELLEEFGVATQTASPAMEQFEAAVPVDSITDEEIELQELRELLPGIPISRLRGVRDAYSENLSDPSLLTLVPILRETMPDWFTSKSLRASNARNARFVLERAKEAGLLDVHVLNGMLQFYTSAGSIEHALALYDDYDIQKLNPTSYSDRLVVQMLLKQRRFQRCLGFKQKVEEQGRKLDLLAYGSLVDHCSKHSQVGSALMLLEECIRVNGAPPGESYVKELRILCRREDIEEEVGLEGMIGEDPIMWKKYGEAVLKPGKAGKQSYLNIVRNAGVRV